jgi:putative transposase
MKILQKRRKVSEFIIDETLLKIGNQYAWIWVAAEPTDRVILDIRISFERTILVAEKFIKDLIKKYGKHPLSTDGGTWYSQACRFVKMKHHLHSSYEKSFIGRKYNTSRIELNALMITFLVKKKSVNYNTSIIGSIYLLTIIIRKW